MRINTYEGTARWEDKWTVDVYEGSETSATISLILWDPEDKERSLAIDMDVRQVFELTRVLLSGAGDVLGLGRDQ